MQKLTRSLLLTGVLALGGLVGCGDDVSVINPEPPADAVTGITITPSGTTTLLVGQTADFAAQVTVTGNAARTAAFSSSNAAVATVNAQTGRVTAVAPGQTTITAAATADANFKATAQVIVSRGVNGVTVAPQNAILLPTQTLQAGATVDAAPGVARTVTWSSSAAGVATVNATTGVITAVAPGTATITAASTVDPTVTGALALTVRQPVPAAISIKSVTTGTTNTPVNFNNVVGQIDVTVNVDPGDTPLSKVELLIDGNVVASQNFSPAEIEALRLKAVYPEVEAAEVVFSVQTSAFNPATGVPTYYNGVRQLSARAVPAGTTGGGTASTSVALTFNNTSGFYASLTNTNTNTGGTFPASAVNTGTGQGWTQGTHVLKLIGVNYVQGSTYTNIAGTLFGKVFTAAAPTTAPQTYEFTFSGTTAAGLGILGYLSPVGGEFPAITGAALSNGQAGSTVILNSPANAPTFGFQPLPNAFVDNLGPAAPAVNTGVPIWLNAAYTFMPSAQYTAGSDLVAGAGVAGVTTKFYYILAATGLPAGCSTTGMTEITSAANLAETLVSTIYVAKAVSRDALGNPTCATVSNPSFGADFVTPTITAQTGPANNSFFTAAPVTAQTFTVTDNASGFGAAPVRVNVTRLNANNSTSCVWGSGTGCVNYATTALTFDPTNGSATDGYYTMKTTVEDQAANRTAEQSILFLLDQAVPTFSGGISLPSVIAGAATNTFNVAVADNMDLNNMYGVVAYGAGNFQYQTQTLGAYGAPLEQSANVAYAASDWMRCINPAGDLASTGNQPTTITMFLQDQANNSANLASGAFGANAQACGTVGNIAAVDILAFETPTAPNYGAGKTQVDIDGASLAAASSATVTFTAVSTVALNTSLDPFTRVDFFYQNAAGNWVKIGQAAAVLSQTPANRFWTYTITWNPGAGVPVGAVPVIAIGIDAQGDAVLATATAVQNITTVP